MRRLLTYVHPYRGRVALGVGLLLAGALIELVGPALTMLALDHAVPAGDSRMLGLIALAYVAALAFGFLLEYSQTLVTTWLGQKVMFDLRREIFAHLQRLSLSFHDRNPVGRSMTRVTNDVEVLNELFRSGIVAIFGDFFTLLFIVAMMLYLDWRLALVALTVLPAVVYAASVFRKRIRVAYRDIRIRLARINAYLQEQITGISVTQLFGRERDSAARFREVNEDHLRAHLRSITYYALFFPTIELFTSIAVALIIWYGGLRVVDGTITIGVVAAFLQYSRRFFRPIQDLSEKYNMLQGAMASSERIFGLLDTEPDTATTEQVKPRKSLPSPGRGEIEFRNVWFAYRRREEPDGEWDWVLRDVSFRVAPGSRVAIVGHTGAGKTSVINLLLRFYEPQRGVILFDGVPIRDVDPAELRSRIGLVLQDVFLFSRDIRYNIRLGREDLGDDAVMNAAARVGADKLIAGLEHGLDEPVGERGAGLSMGERQLLSFARALAYDPLVLVLDEATSSVDSELEERIEEAVETLMRGRTAIVIAHRLSTVRNADRILVFHHGELREQGTHEELLRLGGIYNRLHELQFAGDVAGPPEVAVR
ncbi:MAG TPA: ABC transporter ATP-binding protein [Longimicrobiales bacterium]|nr:ABC transporter ATP-binding protein [Longimicrobiales bacterium]